MNNEDLPVLGGFFYLLQKCCFTIPPNPFCTQFNTCGIARFPHPAFPHYLCLTT